MQQSAPRRRYVSIPSCGASVVDRLGLTRESADDLRGKIRYVSARFDDELATLEDAEARVTIGFANPPENGTGRGQS